VECHKETTWVILTKLLGTPLDEWDACEADDLIKQQAAEFYDNPVRDGNLAEMRRMRSWVRVLGPQDDCRGEQNFSATSRRPSRKDAFGISLT
jgi:hypothetical protein